MQCEEFDERLNAALDERQRPEWNAELQLHLETCQACRRLAAAYEVLLDGFYELATPAVPPDMPLRVVSEHGSQSTPARRVSVTVAALAAAATLLVAVFPFVRGTWRPWGDAGRPPQQAASPASDPALTDRPAPQLPIVPRLLAASTSLDGDPYAGFAKGTGQNLATVMLYVPGIGGSKGIIDADLSSRPNEERSWAARVSEGLKPVSDSVTETLSLLLDSLPPKAASRS